MTIEEKRGTLKHERAATRARHTDGLPIEVWTLEPPVRRVRHHDFGQVEVPGTRDAREYGPHHRRLAAEETVHQPLDLSSSR